MAEINLPENMTEEELLKVIRQLFYENDDMTTDEELLSAFQTGVFDELRSEIEQYALLLRKDEAEGDNAALEEAKGSDDDNDSLSTSKKQFAKEKMPEKEKDRKPSSKSQTVEVEKDTSAQGEGKSNQNRNDDRNQHSTCRKEPGNEKMKDKEKEPKTSSKNQIAKVEKDVLTKGEERSNRDKNDSNQHSTSKKEPGYDKEKKKEPKPFSKYNSEKSKTSLKRWHPLVHKDHRKYQKKFNLKPVSVVCVDLLHMPMMFYNPEVPYYTAPNAVPLQSATVMTETDRTIIQRLERDKSNWYKSKLNRRVKKLSRVTKDKDKYKDSFAHSVDNDRRNKKVTKMDVELLSISSDELMVPIKKKKINKDKRNTKVAKMNDELLSISSDELMVPVQKKKVKKDSDGHKERKKEKLTKTEKEAAMRKKTLEEIVRKVNEKIKPRNGTRLLDWQHYKKKKEEEEAKEAARKRLLQKQRELKMKKSLPLPFMSILKDIESANKLQAAKPKVELTIPKNNPNAYRPVSINQGKPAVQAFEDEYDVYKGVAKILTSNVLVECPVLGDDLGDYTVKKIAWWILKNEKDPAAEGVFHPECHDDDDQESIHSDDFDWPDDVSSLNGCVSDPEGLDAEIGPDPQKVADPDWIDEYCGEASLEAKFRKETSTDERFPVDSMESFRRFLRVKPGTNYMKSNFQVKCHLCNEVISGQRQFGAHIRSASHKNKFRNYSLDMANYEENVVIPPPRKQFVAQLVEYSANSIGSNRNSNMELLDNKIPVTKVGHARSESPGPIVAGDAAPNIIVHQMPIPDVISLPSYEDYDISPDESLMNVRVAIRTAGKWDNDLERRWRTYRNDEALIAEAYNAERDRYINEPERYPDYEPEWLKFWERRCEELEAEGKDPGDYDLQKEWLPFWLKRMQEIMKEKVERRVAELKRSLFIDKHTLRSRFGINAEATKSSNKKIVNNPKDGTSKSTKKKGHGPPQKSRPIKKDERVRKRPHQDSVSVASSVSSNTRKLHDRMQAVREKSTGEKSYGSNNYVKSHKVRETEKLVNSMLRKKSFDHSSKKNTNSSKQGHQNSSNNKSQNKDEKRDNRSNSFSSFKRDDHRGPPPKDDKRRWENSKDNRKQKGNGRHQNKDFKSSSNQSNPPPKPSVHQNPKNFNSRKLDWQLPKPAPPIPPAPIPQWFPTFPAGNVPFVNPAFQNLPQNNVNYFAEDTWGNPRNTPWPNQGFRMSGHFFY